MGKSRVRASRCVAVMALAFASVATGVGVRPAVAQVTAVKGSATGFLLNVSLFGGPVSTRGPAPTVTLPSGGSATAVSATAPSAVAGVDPATLFSSGQLDVSTQGTLEAGTVMSSSTIVNLNASDSEALTATRVVSTCTASATGVSGSTTITGGVLQTDSGDDNGANSIPDHPAVTVPVPINPAPNTVIEGHVHLGNSTDTFRFIFNEQIRNADGSITINAARQVLVGPTAVGELIIGQSVCGVTGSAPATTTTTTPGATTTTAPGATTTTAPGATTTTAPGATTTSAPTTTSTAPTTTSTTGATTTTAPSATGVGGGAYGYFLSVGLFGGAPASRGPAPTVTLGAAGSATPITDSAPSANGQFGPATLLSSDRLEVSTQGVPGGSVTSSAKVANVNKSGQEVLTAAEVASTCTASASGASGSTTLTGAKLTVSEGANLDSAADDTVIQLPANPAPNTTHEGKIETVQDTFRYVFNEQVKNADGSITVNAAHQYLLGPTAVGEVIIGQSRCGVTAGVVQAGGGAAGGGVAGGSLAAAGGGLVATGSAAAVFVAVALMLLAAGSTTTYWVAGVRWRDGRARRMPWPARSPLP